MKINYLVICILLLVLGAGCKKKDSGNTTVTDGNTKGVVEIRVKKSYGTFYEAYVVGQNNGNYSDALCTEEKFTTNALSGSEEHTFYYWPDKSANDLGYSNGSLDGTGSPYEFPYFANYPCYITSGGNTTYGANGYFAGHSCGGGTGGEVHNRYTKGVVEVRVTSTFNNNTSISYEAYPVGQNYTFVAACSYGEKTVSSPTFGSVDVFRYFYWPNKTVLDLGYGSYSAYGFSKSNVYGLVTSMDDSCFFAGAGNDKNPGTNGYFNGHGGDCH